ncbi:LysR family transcriptional regulator [Xanthomonas arboricola pv. celebensis]|uniref:LysR family transcriptional regulator n=1 Tax=Xanthomonas arboricola TaxID=56448 RepID=UPI0004D50AB7|nr:LysR family transcriptional regulator [Xanthomonas arboricola]KER87886.1 LysR family transcriptional regulator [Xanthomonas arboricola pv. celebensis]
MDSLSDIAAFVRTAERLSFAEAGRDLGLSPSAIGKSVARIEASLGVRLFHRTTRRVSLTNEGALLHERCRLILSDLRDAEELVAGSVAAPRGTLRISLPAIGYRFLISTLPDFLERYPEIEFDLDFNDRFVDLVEGGFDAAIRSGPLVDSSLMSRRLGSFRFVLCAAPCYLNRKGAPIRPVDLGTHDALRFRFPSSGKLQDWNIAGDVPPACIKTVLTCNNMEAIRAAAIDGLGIAYMPDFLAEEALRDGALVTVLDRFLVDPGQFSIVWSSSRQISSRLRVFIDFVSKRLFADNF